MDVCSDLSLEDLPEEGENNEGVPWSEIRDTVESFCGWDTDDQGGHVNMTPDEVRSWSEHECANKKSLDPEMVRERVLKPLETHPEDWESEGDWRDSNPDEMGHLEIASKASSYNARGYGSWEQYGPYKDFDGVKCPSGWGIANLNWAQDPEYTYEGDYYEDDT
jgi:hypothetical protein